MNKNNDFSPVVVDEATYDIAHLKGNDFSLDVLFDNGDCRNIAVNVRPTNHLFSRGVKNEDRLIRDELMQAGSWLTSYQHHEGDYQEVKKPPVTKEHRIFCKQKWQQSFLFPKFIELLKQKPNQVIVLANVGDDKTCLSGRICLPERSDDVYLVFFTLTKKSSKAVNMLIESAYCVSCDHPKAQKLLDSSSDKKPFITALKNVMEGRKPLVSQKKNTKARKMRKQKRKKPQ